MGRASAKSMVTTQPTLDACARTCKTKPSTLIMVTSSRGIQQIPGVATMGVLAFVSKEPPAHKPITLDITSTKSTDIGNSIFNGANHHQALFNTNAKKHPNWPI